MTEGCKTEISGPSDASVNGVTDNGKPRLYIDNPNPDKVVEELRDILSVAGGLYDRGVPVSLAHSQMHGGTVVHVMTAIGIVHKAHSVSRPYKVNPKNDEEVDARLPTWAAHMYRDWEGEWRLPPLNGIASSPLLHQDGAIFSSVGYDVASGMYCEEVPEVEGLVPARPTREEAEAGLREIRELFKTFPFADAEMVEQNGAMVVDTTKPPGRDESAFVNALLTAVCRSSLDLAPGVLLRAASISGAGTGKGLLARCICNIASGREPHAVTAGADTEELEKRIGAELMEGSPALYLDNLNDTSLKSDLLASAITERPSRVRLLGKSQMVLLNSAALVILTGNGLRVTEDLARRFLPIELDARTENPETRRFTFDIRKHVKAHRQMVLAALLTIWRWGRLVGELPAGIPLGSFDRWSRWVRDPLLALGCPDPAERIHDAKERDSRRQAIADLFEVWWNKHQGAPVRVRDLDEDVLRIIDPQGRGRQYVSSRLVTLTDTRVGGYALTRQTGSGKWSVTSYALVKTGEPVTHRDHRVHRAQNGGESTSNKPQAPYDAYAFGDQEKKKAQGGAGPIDPIYSSSSVDEEPWRVEI